MHIGVTFVCSSPPPKPHSLSHSFPFHSHTHTRTLCHTQLYGTEICMCVYRSDETRHEMGKSSDFFTELWIQFLAGSSVIDRLINEFFICHFYFVLNTVFAFIVVTNRINAINKQWPCILCEVLLESEQEKRKRRRRIFGWQTASERR